MCWNRRQIIDRARNGERLVGDVVESVLLGGRKRGDAFGEVGLELLGSVGLAACW